MEKYFTIGREGVAEYKILGSKFMSFAYPVRSKDEFKTRFDYLKQLHPKANHHCFAYRVGIDGSTFRSSDDREPRGTAGKPILGLLESNNLTNILIVVVRYFGGTLLGIPRLTTAYRTSASLVLQCTPIIERHVMKSVSIECNYPELDQVQGLLQRYDAEIQNRELQLFCSVRAQIPLVVYETVVRHLNQINGVAVSEI